MNNGKFRLTAEQKQQLNNAEKEVNHTQLLKRIQCIKLKDIGWTNIMICEFLNVCNRTIADWINDFQEQGLVGLLSWDYEGRASLLDDSQLESVRLENDRAPFINASEAVEFIESEFGIKYNVSWVQKLLKKKGNIHVKKT